MDPSVIFAIIAGTIIIVGRIINRIAEKNRNEIEDTTHAFDAQHEFDGEEAIPARPNSDDSMLAGSILAQILAEKHSKEVSERMLQPTYIRAPKSTSIASTPKVTKKDNKTKPQPRVQQKSLGENNDAKSNSEILEDLDLRKAVIYAEILKPKFDE